jgi:hypothetical protein
MTDYATLLRDHVTLTCASFDRIYLQGWVSGLQTVAGVCAFLRRRDVPIPSSVVFGQIGEDYVKRIHRWAEEQGVPVYHFEKGERKEEVAERYFAKVDTRGGEGKVVLLGIAQESAFVWRSWRARGQEQAAHPHLEWGRQRAYINHFYWYIWDREWGKTFWKTNAYCPYPVWLWLNGHEFAKRQLEKRGIGYQALDNGFRSCENPDALQQICDRLGTGAVLNYFWRWFWRLPSPFTQDDLKRGFLYQLAVRQLEISDTRVFSRPQAGRAFFEGVIRDNLDIGRPERVALVFDRKVTARTTSTFSTRVVTRGVDPVLSSNYKHSRIKQYLKDGRALRTETVINNTRDFGIGRTLSADNWSKLRSVGRDANRRLCDAQAHGALPAPDVATIAKVTRPSQTDDGLHAPGLCFGDPRVMALLAALLLFTHLVAGFRNRQLVALVSRLLDRPYTNRQATYDLRRLLRKGLIERMPHSQRYLPTPEGRGIAVLFTKTHSRILGQGLSLLELLPPMDPQLPLASAWQRLDQELDDFMEDRMIAA